MLTASLNYKVILFLIHLTVELNSPEAKYRASTNNDDDDDTKNMINSILSRISTATSRVRSQVRSRGIDGGQNGSEVGFLWVRFPLPILIPSTAPYSVTTLSSTLYSLDIDSIVK